MILFVEYLEEYVGSSTRRAILYQENVKGISVTGMQSNYGFDGQIHACWMHKMTQKTFKPFVQLDFLHDIIAQICYARRLAEKLSPVARMIDLPGGHLVSHERTEEVNQTLIDLIKASEKKISPQDLTNLPQTSSGPLEKLRLYLLYLCGLFMLAFEYARRLLQSLLIF
ncbi:hypothetical protein CICLE_v10023844mg [Citrus x clementina]|uniref:Uncharacterized protein n=1 Tax=Citrus clementina TaxID=85681 RepID=V4T2D3_CITCL|nr:hypothetical protein CICLE_v10023844mg [Citrus x clementina]